MKSVKLQTFGFTLAEVLIALALLGIIAAFTIPKVLQATGEQHKIAVMRETYATLSTIAYEARMNPPTVTEFPNFFLSRLNALHSCNTDSLVQGCWDASMDNILGPGGESNEPGVILPNNVRIVGFSPCCTPPAPTIWTQGSGNSIVIDYNGLDNPNRIGEDQLYLDVCYSRDDCIKQGTLIKAGQLTVVPIPVNQALFAKVVSGS